VDKVSTAGVEGCIGIAHTRWATHGAPSERNAHPHLDCTGRIAVVHNGIIENYDLLRTRLEQAGHSFRSETDTEVIAHLIEHHFSGDLVRAVRSGIHELCGTFGLAVISADEPDRLIVARRGSPLVVGVGDGEGFVASDVAALVEHTRKVIYLDDGELAILRRNNVHILSAEDQPVAKNIEEVSWGIATIERGGHPHFMLKEIHEQPESIRNTIRGRLDWAESTAKLGGLEKLHDKLKDVRRVLFTACGTSWHAGLIGANLIEDLARLRAETHYASEFRYRNPIIEDGTAVVAISQSGETADTLAALREAKRRGALALGICNVVGSTIARETDAGIYLHAGPEIGVASTKAFTSQLVALHLMALYLARQRGLSVEEGTRILQGLERIPEQVEWTLAREAEIVALAELFRGEANSLYLGRGYNFPVALEGALKLKEVSYIHAEGYPAAEMKHGPIAIIDENMPVVFLATRDRVYEKILGNIAEVRARKGRVIAVATEGDESIVSKVDHVVYIPAAPESLTPILAVIPLQLLAYHVAVMRGCDVDKPRHLAKSVTVE
jgi:glucosamine--fructose-6-phosphate aminotransferase (isomerizing)